MHVERSGEFALPLALRHAFPLFTPEGERAWVKAWDPVYLHPEHPSSAAGTVFRTGHGDEETLWLVLSYEPMEATVRYARVTPGSRLGTVTVQCESRADEETLVRVTYALTGLTVAGNAMLAGFTAAKFTAMLGEWRTAIVGATGR